MSGAATADVSAPLPWQDQCWAQLLQQFERGTLPHALLLTGPQDTGKSRFALALARLLLCSEPAAGLNCGQCHACALSGSGNHGDLRWLEPEGKSRVSKIEAIRSLVEFTNRTAGFGLRKVAVLAPAENMNASAANALLKSLEEPAAETYLILVSHRPHALPATIRSRCQSLRLGMPGTDPALQWLQSAIGDDAGAAQLLEIAGGHPLRAERLYREQGAQELLAIRQCLQALLNGAPVPPGELAALLAEQPLEQALAHLVDGLQAALRQQDSAALAAPSGRALFQLLDELLRLRRALDAGSNPNGRLLLDALLTRLQRELGEAGLGAKIHSSTRGTAP
jgi:DNA polymerase-3 subunit delta'